MSTKIMQGRLWSSAPQYWAKHFEPYFLPLYRKALEQLNLKENDTLLDAGCGSGIFSGMAIKAGAQVMGIDAAPGLLEVARQRNPKNAFLEEDLEAMPFADQSFDVVTGFNSFQYAGDFQNALLEAKRVLNPKGRLVIAIWDRAELSDATTVLKAIGALLPPPPPGTPGPFALSEDGKIEAVLSSIGMRLIHKSQVPCSFVHSNIDHAVNSFMGTGPAAAAINYTTAEHVRRTIAGALKQFSIDDDLYFLQNQFLLFVAEK